MSASLTVSSASLASDGKTITVNIAGVSGSLSPASAITGFKVFDAGAALGRIALASVTSSGTVVTITTDVKIAQGNTVVIDLLNAAGPSNLTDGAGNTPTGQTSVATTNNSTQVGSTFQSDNAGIFLLGRLTSQDANYFTFVQTTQLCFVVNATDLNLRVAFNSSISISVDGGAFTPVTHTATTAHDNLKVFSGLAASDHFVRIQCTGATALLRKAQPTFTSFGGTGAIRLPGFAQGFGPYYQVSDVNFPCRADSQITYTGSLGLPQSYKGDRINCQFRFRARCDGIKLFGRPNAQDQDLNVYRDGTWILTVHHATGGYDLRTLIDSGLDDGSEHEWMISTENFNSYMDGVMIIGPNTIWGTKPSYRKVISFYGASSSAGSIATKKRYAYDFLLAQATRQCDFNWGVAGTLVVGTGSSGQARTANITDQAPEPEKCVVLYGMNDFTAGGATPSAAFGTAFQSMLTLLLTGTVATKFYVVGLIPASSKTAVERAAWNGAGNGIKGSVDAVLAARPQDALRLKWIDPEPWQMAGPTDADRSLFADSVHPNDAGHAFIAQKLFPYLVDASGKRFTMHPFRNKFSFRH